MSEENEVQVLYRNNQWMVQDEPRGQFIVQINRDYPDDLEGSYWMRVRDVAVKLPTDHRILHVCAKRWVDIDAFEEAVKAAFLLFGVRPDYDVAAEFKEARHVRTLMADEKPVTFGLKKPSEVA